ncbi:MAG: type II toxin-antitoxin system antitoxin SocA domain-containing protein, partial [Bacilli bacterium]
MKGEICNCSDTFIKNHLHEFCIKGKKIIFKKERKFCKKCEKLVYDAVLDNEASLEAVRIYNEKYGINKEDIINLRNKYNLSQEMFAKIIGCAKKTLISYELGNSIPNDVYLVTLKTLLVNPSTISTMIEANKERYNKKEYEKIMKKIFPFAGANAKQILNHLDSRPTIYNGYTQLSLQKIENLLLYLAKKTIFKTKILKELFYIDFINYKETGASITGLEYAKLPYGPVPDDFESLFRYFSDQKIIDYSIEIEDNCEYHRIKALKEPNLSIFTEYEIKIIDQIKKFFKNYTVKEIVKYSHCEKAFEDTKYNENISYEYS